MDGKRNTVRDTRYEELARRMEEEKRIKNELYSYLISRKLMRDYNMWRRTGE